MTTRSGNVLPGIRNDGRKTSFMERFGGDTGAVDFNQQIYGGDVLLPTPAPDDTLEVVAEKLGGLAQIVRTGKNVAIITGYKRTAFEERYPVAMGNELLQYDAWVSRYKMPKYDWENCVKPIVGGARAKSRFARRALGA
ncbi:hypothetical protein Golomagni_05108 [Golovinomyces magnicellulatus]|nr:hypothetical protein Golomagni_05108 [Golovinomyces magnicellulatus]